MLNLPRITAICYDGRPFDKDREEKYHKIIAYQNSKIKFNSIKMFLTYKFENSNVQSEIIDQCDINAYSHFCLRDLSKHFDTDYVLIFQDDGFAMNPDLWNDEFLKYDYVGAPWPDYLEWNGTKYRVGNGGFSLRSKRLCEFSKTLPISGRAEDADLCVYQRDILNRTGLKVAPISIARKFSVERSIDDNHVYTKTFGFHGVYQHELQEIFNLIAS